MLDINRWIINIAISAIRITGSRAYFTISFLGFCLLLENLSLFRFDFLLSSFCKSFLSIKERLIFILIEIYYFTTTLHVFIENFLDSLLLYISFNFLVLFVFLFIFLLFLNYCLLLLGNKFLLILLKFFVSIVKVLCLQR